MPNLVNDFEVRKETLRALGGDPTGLANIYEVDLEILKILSEGGVGIDWDTIKQKLAEDGVESIKFTMGAEEVILTAEEVKNLLNQTVLPDAPIDGVQYARQNGEWTPIKTQTVEKYMTITVLDGDAGTTIAPTLKGSITPNLQYRINNGEWTDFIFGTTTNIHVVAGDFVQFKGYNPNGLSIDYDNYLQFLISGNPVHLSGNIMSIIDGIGETLVIPNGWCFWGFFKKSNIKTVSKDFLPATTLSSYCYYRMFIDCTNLVQSPALPSTTISNGCYCEMFYGCENLTQAPELPATTLAGSCYDSMFSSCFKLTQAPELPATNLESNCYKYMFAYSGLTQAPELHATNLAYMCYNQMFHGCSKLKQAPELPAITLAEECYSSMFWDCTNLVQVPELPATTLANHCYSSMFQGCTKLVQAPELPATTLADYCYYYMFNGCTSLNYVKCLATEGIINADGTVPNTLTDWLSGVSTTGTFEKPSEAVYVTDSQGGIPQGWTVKDISEYTEAPKDGKTYGRNNGAWTPVENGILDAPSDGKQYARQNGEWTVVESGGGVTPEGKYMTITVDESNSGETIIRPNVTGSLPNLNLQYRVNSGDWNEFIVGTTEEIHVVAGDVVQFKGNNPNGLSMDDSNLLNFYISKLCHLSGNVMSLIDGVGDSTVIPNDWCFYGLFRSSKVKTVTNDFLPATTLKKNCYDQFFWYCTELVNAPSLPALVTEEMCYSSMFSYCSSLLNAPSLPSEIISAHCYLSMFYDCSSLLNTPELKAKNLEQGCYQEMFHGCTSLVNVTDLPSEKISGYCYNNMFGGCTSLKIAPILPAKSIPTDVWGCYQGMFSGCTSLNYVKICATEISGDDALTDMLKNVSPTGTFVKPDGVVYETGVIPEGWTIKEFDVIEVPNDGKQYSRKDGAWVEAEPNKVKTTNNTTMQFWKGTQQEYDAIATKDANTLYIIS